MNYFIKQATLTKLASLRLAINYILRNRMVKYARRRGNCYSCQTVPTGCYTPNNTPAPPPPSYANYNSILNNNSTTDINNNNMSNTQMPQDTDLHWYTVPTSKNEPVNLNNNTVQNTPTPKTTNTQTNNNVSYSADRRKPVASPFSMHPNFPIFNNTSTTTDNYTGLWDTWQKNVGDLSNNVNPYPNTVKNNFNIPKIQLSKQQKRFVDGVLPIVSSLTPTALKPFVNAAPLFINTKTVNRPTYQSPHNFGENAVGMEAPTTSQPDDEYTLDENFYEDMEDPFLDEEEY